MKNIFKTLLLVLFFTDLVFSVSWDKCIEQYNKAKKFDQNTQLSYSYLKSTKQCISKFKNYLKLNPNPEFTIQAMSNNIEIIDKHINELIPKYKFTDNHLVSIPKYLKLNTNSPILNKEYSYFKRFDQCNGIHAGNKIYTAKHCNIKNATNIIHDLSFVPTKYSSNLEISKINLEKTGTFKYYSMSKEGMFFQTLLKESNCKFYKAKNIPSGINTTLDFTDLNKNIEIRSNCLAIPSNSGGGVFQEDKLVAIISKTVFKNNQFLYSVVEPIVTVIKH